MEGFVFTEKEWKYISKIEVFYQKGKKQQVNKNNIKRSIHKKI